MRLPSSGKDKILILLTFSATLHVVSQTTLLVVVH